jgi:hypothetical protein
VKSYYGASYSRAFELLEPCEGKLSCTVLRGGSGGNIAPLPDRLKAGSSNQA